MKCANSSSFSASCSGANRGRNGMSPTLIVSMSDISERRINGSFYITKNQELRFIGGMVKQCFCMIEE
ncbi:hypothetical protein OH492_19775 [Vibrio chagasii]|nr:hypothetical protein [Vibrio chagasii]